MLLGISLLCITGAIVFSFKAPKTTDLFVSCTIDPRTQNLQLYWKNELGEPLRSIQGLKNHVESKGQTLVFAMNGGMFTPEFSPQGLFIQNGTTLTPLDTADGYGNFYLKPNGVFCLRNDKTPLICTTANFRSDPDIRFATQSGPMLVIDGQIHPEFKAGSGNVHIRNGVGILPDNRVLFALSKNKINLYDFARYFQEAGCKNALYLDGFVSRAYLPAQDWIQTDGNFGVMIGVTE